MKTHVCLLNLLVVSGISALSPLNAQTKGVVVSVNSNGRLNYISLIAPQIPQKTRDNCGPCAASVALAAEAYKRIEKTPVINEALLKQKLDADKSGGVNLEEMRNGIQIAAQKYNKDFKFTGTAKISENWASQENRTRDNVWATQDEMDIAMGSIQYWMLRSKSTVLIQGNMDIWWRAAFSDTRWDGRGDHWYTVWVAGNTYSGETSYPFVCVMDSVFNSAVFKSSQGYAIAPRTMNYSGKVRDMWRPTGSSTAPGLHYVVNGNRP